jgi:glycosyltransferase involved in cell wall biosynthesis
MIGGGEVYLREMLPRLRALGLEPEAALPKLEGNRPIREALAEQGIAVHAYTDPAQVPRQHDLYIASTWYPQNALRFHRLLPQPPVMLIHDQIEIWYPLGLYRLYRLGYRLLQVPNLQRAKAVVTVSSWAARWLREVHGVRPEVFGVPNGVDTQKFRPPLPGECEALRQKLGLERFSVLVPHRMSPEKNHGSVLLAARQTPEVDYLLVGVGELMGYWQKTARLLGLTNVRFLGRRMDMPELYRAADAMLQPTLGENLSLVTLEAMSSGLPVISSPIPAQAELIEDGVNGLLVPARPALIARAVRELAADPARACRLGEAGRAKVLRQHTLEATASLLAQVLCKLV